MHALDHLISEALGTTVKCGNKRFGAFDLCRTRRERLMTWRDLVGMNQALAVEAEAAAVLRFLQEAVGIVEVVEHAVESRDAGGPRGKHNHLQRGGNRLTRGIKRQTQVGAKIICSR